MFAGLGWTPQRRESSYGGGQFEGDQFLSDEAQIQSADTPSETAGPAQALGQMNELFGELMAKSKKGLGTSSMGKFDKIRPWLAGELGIEDWRKQTYAVGASTAAHNFKSRWTQNTELAGTRMPLGIAFLRVPEDAKEAQLLNSALNANKNFVSGVLSTSFEAIITFIHRPDETVVRPYSIQSVAGSKVADRLAELFPGAMRVEVEWKRGTAPTSGNGSNAVAAKSSKPKLAAIPLGAEVLSTLEQGFETGNYQAPNGLAGRAIAALAAKPFLLLAGLSGTGKTLLGLAVSTWLAESDEQVEIVAVGADWTSGHHLLGYPDALDPDKYVKTPALDLMLRADRNPDLPYFLILDEMNLSHVERYFSDFLSTMESHREIVLHGSEKGRDGVPWRLAFPRNLFVVGTINVDETTYMFSPKVIDRANVIEFTVDAQSMGAYLAGGADFDLAAFEGEGRAFASSLLAAVRDPANFASLDDEVSEVLRSGLQGLFEVLDRSGLQFGFRTAREIIRFVVVHRILHPEDWSMRSAIDAQLAQRLLPRLSGDVAKLRPPLIALLAFCKSWSPVEGGVFDVEATLGEAQKLAKLDQEGLRTACSSIAEEYPLTASKLVRVFKRLAEQGFTTAIEA